MRHYANRQRGFTFVEVLLVIGILGVVVSLSIPFYQSFQVSNQLDNISQEVAQTLRRAQNKAMASEYFSAHGVHLQAQQFILFKGDSYNPADAFNEVVDIPSSILITYNAGPDVVFSGIKGEASYAGLITITTNNGESKSISINEMGVVNVQ
ncbi:type II secretion system GspH family protein [Patescibacteria group bacterium]|nr:type II secretion system GspH family protein [Patescibacteria group bacterium]MBU0964122.1 type II secretion system GspH family protein [Patescibacteria group bacterium]